MVVVCGIPDLQNPAVNCPTQLFIDSQGFTWIDNFTIIHIRDVPRMIKEHSLVTNTEARSGAIQQHKLQAILWWEKGRQCRGLAITTTA